MRATIAGAGGIARVHARVIRELGSEAAGVCDRILTSAKRPLHTIMPGMPVGQAQIISGAVDCGLDIQDAIDRPRSFLLRGVVQREPAPPIHTPAPETVGFAVQAVPRAVGGAHGVVVDGQRRTHCGGSDPRKDGCALAL